MNRKNAFFQKHIMNKKLGPIAIAYLIMQQMFGDTIKIRGCVKAKLIKMLSEVVVKQKNFDYNYYLSKNCPMPDDWNNRKKFLKAEAAKGGSERGAVYKELYDADSSYH